MICQHRPCKNEVPPGRERYCCAAHRKAAKTKRTPSYRRCRAARNAARVTAYVEFVAAARARKQLKRSDLPKVQATARRLVAGGAIAYENAQGEIRDVGAAKRPEDAGRVFSARRREGAAA